MYNNNLYQRGRVEYTPADDYPYPTGAIRSIPSARGNYQVPVHAGTALPQPGIPAYLDQAPRPVYRQRPSPVTWPGAATQPQPQLQPHMHAHAPYPYPSMASAPLRSPPAVNYRPFHVHPANVDPGRFEFSRDELAQLRSASFGHEDQRQLAAMPSENYHFVMHYVGWLGSAGFSPAQILDTARLAPNQRRFVADQCATLVQTGLGPGHVIDLAQMAQSESRFVLDHGATLRAIGFTPMQMLLLANCPDHERRYITDHGYNLRTQGYLANQIREQARDVSLRPASLQWPAYPTNATAAPPQTRAGYGGQHYPQQYNSQYQGNQQLNRQPYYNQQHDNQLYYNQQAQPPQYPGQQHNNQPYYNQQAQPPQYPGQPYNGALANQPHPSPQYTAEPAQLAPAQPQQLPHARQHAALALRPPRRASTSELPPRQAAAASVEGNSAATRQHGRRGRTPRQATAPETPGLNYAERMAFDELDLPPGALERLARGSDTFRTYVLAHGATLLSSGMTFDEICTMASDSEVPARARGAGQADAAPHIDYPRNDAPLTEDQRTTLAHAHRRWSQNRWTPEVGEAFYRDTVPAALVRAVSAPQPGAHGTNTGAALADLHLLLAGVAYVADNRGADAPGHRARVTRLTAYITAKNDPELLRECDAAAAEGVTRCVDRIAFGLTRVEQVVMRRQVDDGEMAPREMLDSIEKVFVQHLVHDLGTHLANARKVRDRLAATHESYTRESFAAHVEEAQRQSYQINPATGAADSAASESLEMYAALAPVLAAQGVNMVESARTSTYGSMYRIEPLELDYALGIIDGHVRDRSDKFLDDFKGNPAVEKVLIQCFPEEYNAMREQREELQDEADDALFDANATAETQEAVRDVMTALANMDQDWFREKLRVVLAQPHRLDNLLPPDQADSASEPMEPGPAARHS